jgi:flagellar export protein FliJ
MSRAASALETLLRVRQLRRDACRLALADLERQATELDAQRAAIVFERQAELASLRDRESGGRIDVLGVAASRRHLQHLASALDLLLSSNRELSHQIEEQREQLLQSDRDVRSLEKLHEARTKEAIETQRRRETRESDDVTQAVGVSGRWAEVVGS